MVKIKSLRENRGWTQDQLADMLSSEVSSLFKEANSIAYKSPRAATALFRVALETFLTDDLNNLRDSSHKDNYSMIKKLYQNNIPDTLGIALNFVRVAGNAADHIKPGLIKFDGEDGINTVKTLGNIINLLSNRFITEENELNSLTDLFTNDQKEAIKKMKEN